MVVTRWLAKAVGEIVDGLRNSFYAVADLPVILLAIWAIAAGSFVVAIVTH